MQGAGDERQGAQATSRPGTRLDDSSRRAIELFRHEMLEARREKALGGVLLVQPISTTVLTVVSLALAAALVIFAFWGEYTRKAHVSGYLVPTAGLIKVSSREMGTIIEKRVVEGQRVAKGDVLFVISMERRTSDSLDSQAAAMVELSRRRSSLDAERAQQGNIADIEVRALGDRVLSLQRERGRLTLEVQTQEQRVEAARKIVARYRELMAQSLTSQETVDAKGQDLLEHEGRLHALERSRIALDQEAETLRAQANSLRLKAQTQQAALERDMSLLAQQLTEYESRRSFVVSASSSGKATALLAEVGQTVTPGQTLMSLLPENAELAVQLIVPSRSIGFLTPGQVVALRYQAFPYQRFGSHRARVSEIAKTLIMPNEAALPTPLTEPAYRVTVTLDSQTVKAYGQDLPLTAGMLVDADIWLDRRKLFEWVLDPLYSVLGRV